MKVELFDPVMLQTFVAVAECGSFTGAATVGGYTQSAVSRQIAGLEKACRVALFVRGARGVRLTPAGTYLLPYARTVLERYADANRALRAVRELDAGLLRVGAFATANAALIPPVFSRLRASHPKLSLTLRESTTERLLPMLDAGDLDVAVVSTHKSPELSGDARLIRLLEDPLLVALPTGHRLARRRTVRLPELADEPWIVADTPEAVAALHATCANAGFTPDTPLRAAEWYGKLGLVAEGLGVALFPGMAAGLVRAGVVLR
ncbi:MAG: LysR family transcriptional regulator, partial [Micromonosporaceae bacterium]